jgi:hypothetical protein
VVNRKRNNSEELNVRLRLLLTQNELDHVDEAVTESGAQNRSLLVLEAIQANITGIMPGPVEGARCCRIDVRVPGEMRIKVKEVAALLGLTQQNLLRHLLFRYLTQAPWRTADSVSDDTWQKTEVASVP